MAIVTDGHQKPSPTLTIGTSDRGRAYWMDRPYVSADVRESVSRADIVAVPQEGFRDHDGPLFPVGMESILPFVRRALPEGVNVEICVDDEHYTELALHALVLQLGIWIASLITAPVLVNVLSEYIKNRKQIAPDESTVRFKLLVERNSGDETVSIEYEGPSDAFKTAVGGAIQTALANSANDRSAPPQIAEQAPTASLPPGDSEQEQ